MKDMSNTIATAVSIKNAVKTSAENGTGVDLQGYESATIIADVGAEGDTLSSSVHFELSLEHSDDNSTFTDVAQADITDGTISSGGIWLKLDGTAGGNPDVDQWTGSQRPRPARSDPGAPQYDGMNDSREVG